MFFIISKLIGFLASPFWWIILTLIAAWFVKNKRWKRYLCGLAIGTFVLFSNPIVFRLVIHAWEGELEAAESLIGKSKVCVVLGGMASWHEASERIRFYQGADRLLQAVDLYQRGIVKKLVISGGNASLLQKRRPESVYLGDYLVNLGIPESDIRIDSLSRNTHENSVRSMEIIKQEGWPEKIILVTSAFHMQRARGCFEKAGFEVEPYATDPLKSTHPPTISEFFLPSLGVLSNWTILLREWIGLLAYQLKGYV
jgi:uncharacterized SAM-binding protein YcdF (DUF218 family)